MSHTPGPWTVANGITKTTKHSWMLRGPKADMIPIAYFPAEPKYGADAANARLIAAAPELLEALELALSCLRHKRFDDGHLNEIKAAIAKAGGTK